MPHGAPPVLLRSAPRRYASARAAGAQRPPPRSPYGEDGERFVLSTFGLISAGKGLETAIAALPAIVERHPEVLYVIAGRTHPDIAHREGERYRLSLEEAVLDLGLEDHVEFDDRFLSIDAIADLLATTDVFVTPYRNREQISSGALTFGIAAGCAVVATPYWYAQDMLGTGAGTIVPFADPAALADAVCRYIEEPRAARGCARRGATDRGGAGLAVGRGGDRSGVSARRSSSRRAAAGRCPASISASSACAPTICGRSSTTSASCSTRTA